MNSAEKKAARLLQIVALLFTHPEGLTQAEIARHIGVHRSTITHYMPDLPYVYQDGNRIKIDRNANLINICLSLNEATAVHLAVRLLTTQLDRQNPHAAAAIRKLRGALERLAPHVSRHMAQSADVIDDQPADNDFLEALQALTIAWAEGRKVNLIYRKAVDVEPSMYRFAPYYIEPGAAGRSTYVIGWCDLPASARRTFKVERIEKVEMLDETYTIPPDFDPRELLNDAWGIWYTSGQPVEVVLKFSPRVASRVGETRWHRSEQVERQSDGSLLWRAYVAATREMMPWVRGWGADVEVLSPLEMRAELKEEALELMQVYHPTSPEG